MAQISACLRKIGCRCVVDETCPAKEAVHVAVQCVNRFSQLADSVDECAAGVPEGSEVNLSVVSERMSGQGKKDRRLRVAT